MIDMKEELKKINALGDIKSLAMRFIDDKDYGLKGWARAEDVDGNVYELPLSATSIMKPGDEVHCKRAALLICIIEKAFGFQMMNSTPELQINKPDDMIPAYYAARALKPVAEAKCLNEKKARLYDTVDPEYIV